MLGGIRENDRFLKIFLSIYLKKFTHSFQFLYEMFLLPYCLMVWRWLHMKSRLLPNFSNKKTSRDGRSNLACFVDI